MTKAEFRDYVTEHNCAITPINGVNHRGWSAKIYNIRYPHQYYYLTLPLDQREMLDMQVEQACDKLGIPSPF